MTAPHEITAAQLSRLIGTPHCPVLIDVCLDEDFALDPVLVPTARRWDFRNATGLAQWLVGRPSVIICQKGKKLSQGVSAWLRANGQPSEYLSGGMVAWRASHGAVVAAEQFERGGLWVTRHRPKIDRIACPWLIMRFVDPEAQFLFVAPEAVRDVADKFEATAFDIAGAEFAHDGLNCSFDAIIKGFGLHLPALQELAKVIRAADTGRPQDHPVAAGLLAMSVGLSRMHRDDTAQLEAGLALYDALYRWARDGMDETHRCFEPPKEQKA